MWSDLLFPLAVVCVWLCIFALVVFLARWFMQGVSEEAETEDLPPVDTHDQKVAAG